MSGPEVLRPDPIALEQVDAAGLTAFVSERSPSRVGRYFETLIEYWLRFVLKVDLLGVGVQVRRGGVTIGELDFVYRDNRGTVCHLEVAVKFYLHEPRSSGSHFPGPNASDNFEAKASKLFGPQLGLSVEHREDVEARHGLVKGQVFYHVDGERPTVLPDRMSPDHACGAWLRASELASLCGEGGGGVLMAKPHWFAPVLSAPVLPTAVLVDRLVRHFARGGSPQLMSLRDANHPTNEVSRVMVVPDSWPGAKDVVDTAANE